MKRRRQVAPWSGARRPVLVTVLLAVVLLVGACAGGTAGPRPADAGPGADGAFPVTVRHMFGETTVPARPRRLVALGSSDVEVVYALGIRPVGVATFPTFAAADTDGVLPWVREHVDRGPVTLLPNGAADLEKIAALRPDVILFTYGALDDTMYRQLSRIAPTVASSSGEWTVDWRRQLDLIGTVTGESAAAARTEAALTARIAAVRQRHPELDGLTFTFLERSADSLFVYLSADPRVAFIGELGPVASPGVAALDRATGGAFFADLSLERAAEADADVIVANTTESSAESLRATPVLGQLPTVTAGAVALYGAEDLAFLAALVPSPLTIPVVLDRLAADLARAAAAR
ncbi:MULTISPECIES: ABC transporter substrate-binding protein [unclassified Pseudonocardia]|uniref:ABC transporter substrate-binding protein n=1 Tax=unclassified Pseudonocardia TaxID=2619320 RepID=UPI001CF6329C|nr:ABC transporter substrate-binding protein [Pseudonocardia sp. ICBG601]